MFLKKTQLIFDNCHASVDINTDAEVDVVTISVTEYEEDKENTTENNTHFKPFSTTEIYLGNDEVKELIKALEYSLIVDDEL